MDEYVKPTFRTENGRVVGEVVIPSYSDKKVVAKDIDNDQTSFYAILWKSICEKVSIEPTKLNHNQQPYEPGRITVTGIPGAREGQVLSALECIQDLVVVDAPIARESSILKSIAGQ